MEYYGLQEYAKSKENDEIYAVKHNSQFYLKDIHGIETMAKKRNDKGEMVSYFALDKSGTPICPIVEKDQTSLKMDISYYKNTKNVEIYPKRGNHEFYIEGKKYAKTAENDEYFARDSTGKNYYASMTVANGDIIQFPAVDHAGKKIYIEENNSFIYPINLTKNIPLYDIDKQGNEKYLENGDIQFYGYNKFKLPIYAKEKSGNDHFALENFIPYYAFYEVNGSRYEYFPKMKNKKEFYMKRDKNEIYPKFNLDERYAKTEKMNEYLAQQNGIPFYASNKFNVEFYPEANGESFYRVENNTEKLAVNKTDHTAFYARNIQNSEFYPKNFNVVPDVEPNITVDVNLARDPTEAEIEGHVSSRD